MADTIRKELEAALLQVFYANDRQFVKFLREMINRRSLQEITDIFHSMLGFCNEVAGVGIAGHVISPPIAGPQKRSHNPSSSMSSNHSQGSPTIALTGYANNFGAGFGKIGPKGIEGVVIAHVFKPFVTRLSRIQKELKLQENSAYLA